MPKDQEPDSDPEKELELHRQLLRNTNVANYVVQDGHIRGPNAAAIAMYGYPEDVLTGKPFTDFIDDYKVAYWPVIFICATSVVNASAGLVSNLFLMTGQERTVLGFGTALLSIVCVGGFLLGYPLGAIGIALALFIASAVRDLGMAYLLRRRLGIVGGVWSKRGVGHRRQALSDLWAHWQERQT